MKKIFLSFLYLSLCFAISFQSGFKVAAQNDDPYQTKYEDVEMSALRRGLEETIEKIKNQYPELVVNDIDIHKHQITDKYVYRIGASSATYTYEAISYDQELFLSYRPIPEEEQAIVIELIQKRNERVDDRLNCDMITNLMRKHFTDARISDWHFDDNRFEIPKNTSIKIYNQTNSETKEKIDQLKTDIYWIVDLIEENRKFRVKIDAFSGNFVILDPNENYEIDTVSSRMNYYLQFYQDLVTDTNDFVTEEFLEYFIEYTENDSVISETESLLTTEITSQEVSQKPIYENKTSTENVSELDLETSNSEDIDDIKLDSEDISTENTKDYR